MVAIIIPSRRTRQPQGAAQIRPYWRSRGLVVLFNGATFQDLVTRNYATNSGSVVKRRNANGSLGPDISGTQYLEFPDRDALDITGALSIFWRGQFDATTGNYRCVVSKADSNGATDTPFEIYLASLDGKLTTLRASGSVYRDYQSDATDPFGGQATSTMGVIYSDGLIQTVPLVYANNAQLSVATGFTTTGNCTGNAKTLRLGRRQDGGTQLDGSIECVALFNQAISGAEYLALYHDPWGELLIADPRRIYFTSGGTGDTYALTASALAVSSPTLGSGALTQEHALAASVLGGAAPTLQSPALSQDHSLAASNIAGSAPTLGTPALTLAGTLVANYITGSAPVLQTPALTQNHSLTATGLAGSAPVLQSPALTQAHTIVASNLTSAAPTLGTPALSASGDTYALAANSIAGSAPALALAVLVQDHSLTATAILGSYPVLSSPTFGQQHLLTGSDIIAGTPTAGTPDLTTGTSGGTGATVEEIVAALQAAVLPVNVAQVNAVPLAGVGSDADPWRAA